MLPGDVARHDRIDLRLHGRGAAALLDAGKQRILLRSGMRGRVVARMPLPGPQVRPLLRGAVTGSAAPTGRVDTQDLGQSRLRFVALPGLAVEHRECGRAARATESFQDSVGLPVRFKTDFDFGVAGVDPRGHASLDFTCDA